MKGNKKIKLVICIISFIISFIFSFIFGFKLKEELDAIPSKYDEYVPNF